MPIASVLEASGAAPDEDILADDVVGSASLFAEPAGAPDFIQATTRGVLALRPLLAPVAFGSFNAAPLTSAAVLRPGLATNGDAFFAFGARNGGTTPALIIVRAIGTGGLTRTALSFSHGNGNPVEVIALSSGAAGQITGAGFYFTTSDGRVRGCSLGAASGSLSCNEAGTLVPPGLDPTISLLTAYLGNDGVPDLVVTARNALFFHTHTMAAIANLGLSGDAQATPAISTRFHDRWNREGNLLVVPVAQNRLDLVTWPKSAAAGPVEHLWLQHGANARRNHKL
jgi:hypothetical protein